MESSPTPSIQYDASPMFGGGGGGGGGGLGSCVAAKSQRSVPHETEFQ